jgi:hypothetical protein
MDRELERGKMLGREKERKRSRKRKIERGAREAKPTEIERNSIRTEQWDDWKKVWGNQRESG